MPIIEIDAYGGRGQSPDPVKIADELAEIYGSAPHSLWVRFQTRDPGDYAENAGKLCDPVFVKVLLADMQNQDELGRLARETANCIAEYLEVPAGHVHILFEPSGRGRVAFGGELLV